MNKKRVRGVVLLRWSVLAAAGVVPVACSGDDESSSPGAAGSRNVAGDAGAGGGAGASGSSNHAGEPDGGSGVAPHGPPSCSNPQLRATGLVACDEGYAHRPLPVTCELAAEGGAPGHGSGGAGGELRSGGAGGELPEADGTVSCLRDHGVCDRFERGFCNIDDSYAGASAVCESGCVNDDDCASGEFCLCRAASPTGGQCVDSLCRTDADCGGYPCAPYSAGCGGGYACKTPLDSCLSDADCEDGDLCFPGFEGAGPWRCQAGSVCGRPFLVRHEARVARLVSGDAWLTTASEGSDMSGLSASQRQRGAELWSDMALLEHASIAAFARFNLQLLALGAPAELIIESTRAIADETAHARLCFDLASAYAGKQLGPGPLDIAGSLDAVSLGEVVDLVLVEGCFGETGAALDALDAAATAHEPAVRAAYARIARDEQRHAELAFRFVRWALERDYTLVAERIELACSAPELRDHAASAVALPCLRALLDAVQPAARWQVARQQSLVW